MSEVCIGKIVGTHGIKGEIRLISNFSMKEKVFKKGVSITIGKSRKPFIISGYRKHKNYDMITLDNITNINEVLEYIGSYVYINREILNLNNTEYLLDDLIGMKIESHNKEYGIVKDIFDNNGNTLLQIDFTKCYYIPYNSGYITNVDGTNKIITVENVEDLIL